MRVVLGYGVLHALVDATTVTVVFRVTGGHGFTAQAVLALVICYDLIAFGSQLGLGWVLDRWVSARMGVLAGLGLAVAGVAAYRFFPVAAVVLVGLGNAAFHVGAGAQVLGLGLARATPVGLFVAPGALGLAFGVWFGKQPGLGPVWPLALALVLAGAVAVTVAGAPAVAAGARSRPVGAAAEPVPVRGLLVGVLALLLVSIAIRSLVGLSAARGYPASTWLLAGIPAVAFLGKSLGGLLADRIGWIETVGAALLISAVLLAVPGPGPLPLLAGLLCFQMTMPVTLVAVGRLMPTRPATAFGWTCLALAAGAAPTVFGGVGALVVKPMLVGWILIATTAVVAGLHASGVRPRRTLARVGSRGAVTTSR